MGTALRIDAFVTATSLATYCLITEANHTTVGKVSFTAGDY